MISNKKETNDVGDTMDSYDKRAKGGLTEGVVIMVLMFVLAFVLLIGVFLLDIMKPEMDEVLTDSRTNATFQQFHQDTPNTFDNMFMIVFVLLWVGAIILAYFIDAHPIWFILSIIALSAVLLCAGVLSNVYETFYDELSPNMTSSLPMMNYVMNHLVHFIIAIVASILISLFAKSQTK